MTRLLTMDELAERLRVSKRTAYRLAHDQGWTIHDDGSGWRFADSDVERFIASRLRGPRETRERHPLAEHLATTAVAALPACGCVAANYAVYFVEAEGLIKIGHVQASRIGPRLAHLQAQCPVPLRIVRVIRGSSQLEADLHSRFRSHRAHGEWFDSEPVREWLEDFEHDCALCMRGIR